MLGPAPQLESTPVQPPSRCPKCGTKDTFERPRYIPYSTAARPRTALNEPFIEGGAPPFWVETAVPERLVFSCSRCGYELEMPVFGA